MSDYVSMWKDLGMDLESHDLLCQVLPTAVGMVLCMAIHFIARLF